MRGRTLLLAIVMGIAACGASSDSPDDSPASPPVRAGDVPGGPASSSSPGEGQEEGGDPDVAEEAPRFVDTCNLQAAECTVAPPGFKEGSGLAPVDRCAFALQESANLGTVPTIVNALDTILPKVSVTDVLADANRTATKTTSVPGAPAGVAYAFNWQDDDNASTAWFPQGITGSADAYVAGTVSGKRAVLVSFYDTAEGGASNEGVRIAFVDATSLALPKYRFALLVMPKGSSAAPSYDPVRIHAGGIVWFRNFLYVADTAHGFRVFDMRYIFRVATDAGAFGCTGNTCRAANYKYVIPQIGKYEITSPCKPLLSFVSLDSTSDPPALVSGEYCSATACSGPLASRVYRWPLDANTGRLRSKRTFPTEALLTSHTQVQGATSIDGTYYLSSSAPAASAGALYRVAGKKSVTSIWSDSPEDLMVDHGSGWLWSLSEAPNRRAVFAASLTSYPKL